MGKVHATPRKETGKDKIGAVNPFTNTATARIFEGRVVSRHPDEIRIGVSACAISRRKIAGRRAGDHSTLFSRPGRS